MKTITLLVVWTLAVSYGHTQTSLTWPRLIVFGNKVTIQDTSKTVVVDLALPQLRNILGDTIVAQLPEHLRVTNIQLARYRMWIVAAQTTIDSFRAATNTLKTDLSVVLQQRDAANNTADICEQQLVNREAVIREQKKLIRNSKFIWGFGGFGVGAGATGILIAVFSRR